LATRKKSPSKKTPKKAVRKPLTFFQRLSRAFSRLFGESDEQKREKKQQALVRQIKKNGYSKSYQNRLIRAVQSGKATTLQEARGHRAGEARERRAKQIEEQGVSSSQIQSIRNFHMRFNSGRKNFDVERLIEFAQENGYARFVEYRKVWDATRRKYLAEQRAGNYINGGETYLDYLAELAGVVESDFMYYH
jgi:hypothetical protein